MTAEEVIAAVLGPSNWPKWIGEDAPKRIADALPLAAYKAATAAKESKP